MKYLSFFVFWLFVVQAQWALAIVVKDLNRAVVAVENQSADERKRAAKEGLVTVLQRMTGRSALSELPVISSALENPERYLQQFSYSQVDKLGGIEVDQDQRVIELEFGQNSIEALIKRAGLPIWGENRPSVLVWLAIEQETPGEYSVLTPVLEHVSYDAMIYSGQKAGLPLLFPVMDLEDSMKLSNEELWQLQEDRILAASQRYQADSILAGRVYKTSKDAWFGQWKFFFKDKVYSFTGFADDINLYVQEAMDQVAPRLAASYAIVEQETENQYIRVKISGVNSVSDYAKLNQYMNRLSAVGAANISRVDGTEAWFSVELRGTLAQFKQAIKLDPKLQELPNLDDGSLHFSWGR